MLSSSSLFLFWVHVGSASCFHVSAVVFTLLFSVLLSYPSCAWAAENGTYGGKLGHRSSLLADWMLSRLVSIVKCADRYTHTWAHRDDVSHRRGDRPFQLEPQTAKMQMRLGCKSVMPTINSANRESNRTALHRSKATQFWFCKPGGHPKSAPLGTPSTKRRLQI